MKRHRFIPLLLVAVLLAQAVIAGRGHVHTHIAGVSHTLAGVPHGHAHDSIAHTHNHHHALFAHESQHENTPLPFHPTDSDDCSICRHLELAATLSFELELVVVQDAVDAVLQITDCIACPSPAGPHQPRAPPELS